MTFVKVEWSGHRLRVEDMHRGGNAGRPMGSIVESVEGE